MAISGPEALKSLDDAVRDIRREEADISRRVARAAERVAKLRETEADLYRQLAEVRLSDEVRMELSGRLKDAELRAHDMIAKHAEDVALAEEQLKKLDGSIAGLATERHTILERIDTAQDALKALSGKIAVTTANDPAYEAKRREADEKAQIAQQSLAKTETAERDREEKGRPYRDDPLFMYLWEAGYGTRNYRANPLTSWLDSLVARMVNYSAARPNFAMLNEIPLRLREHAERQLEAAEAAEAELDALELAAVDAAGGKPLREDLEAAQAALEKLDHQMSELEDDRNEQADDFQRLAEGRNPAFEEANRLLAHTLGQADIRELVADARRTTTAEDDRIVSKIDDVRARITDEEIEAREHKSRLRILAQRRQELEDIEWEFKKSRYDDPRSVFRNNELADDMLGEFLRGAITAAAYWDQWRRSQSWRPGTSDWGGGIGLPRAGRSKRGGTFNWPSGGNSGGFSRPRSGSRGRRRHGGFKTGGGF